MERGEGIQILHYLPGAEYKPHYDYFDPAQPGTASILRRGGQRVATLVMYLSEPARGGGTTAGRGVHDTPATATHNPTKPTSSTSTPNPPRF